MTTDQAFVEYLLELLEPVEAITTKRMFGGHGIFRESLMFGLVADSTLYLKADKLNEGEFQRLGLSPFMYEKKGKPIAMSYYQAPEEALENVDGMLKWAESAFEAAVRAKKLNRRKKRK